MKKILKIVRTFIPTSLFMTIPLITSAETNVTGKQDLHWLIGKLTGYLNEALVLLMGVAIIIFVWYVIQYYIKPNEERSQAHSYVMYSIIGFFVILSFWGLVNILQVTFGLQNENNRPATWASFSNLFPPNPGGTTSGGGSNSQ